MVSLDEVAKSRKKVGKIEGEESAHSTVGRADVLPIDGFWLEVDGRTKKGWPEFEMARREAKALKEKYPHLRVAVYDAAEKKRSLPD